MLAKIKQFFNDNIEQPDKKNSALPALALLCEVISADNHYSDEEKTTFYHIIKQHYADHTDEIDELMALAKQESKKATDLFQFTSLINDRFDQKRKLNLVNQLWTIAYADNHLDKYEDYIIRKICDLLYVSHSDMIKVRNEIAEKNNANTAS